MFIEQVKTRRYKEAMYKAFTNAQALAPAVRETLVKEVGCAPKDVKFTETYLNTCCSLLLIQADVVAYELVKEFRK